MVWNQITVQVYWCGWVFKGTLLWNLFKKQVNWNFLKPKVLVFAFFFHLWMSWSKSILSLLGATNHSLIFVHLVTFLSGAPPPPDQVYDNLLEFSSSLLFLQQCFSAQNCTHSGNSEEMYYRLNCELTKFISWSPNPQYFRTWLHLKKRL